jgi:hypothetical protein
MSTRVIGGSPTGLSYELIATPAGGGPDDCGDPPPSLYD